MAGSRKALRRSGFAAAALLVVGGVGAISSWAEGSSGGAVVDPTAPHASEGERILEERTAIGDALAKWDAEAEARAEGEAELDPKDARPNTEKGEWPEGILGPGEANLPPGLGFVVQNAWAHSDGDTYYGVYAGIGAGPNGALILETVDPITMESALKLIETDIPGPVAIVSASDTTILIESADGKTTLAFSVATEAFVS